MVFAATSTPSGGTLYQFLHDHGVSDGTAHTIQSLSVGPLRIAVVVVIAWVVTRMVPRTTRRLVRSLQLRAPARLTTVRASERAGTVGAVLGGVFRSIVWIIAFLTILGIIGINLGPFVATATVIGAAVGFGAQSLVKDFLSGILILLEDQYGVGDTITADGVTGTVEGLNLRTTRVRAGDGTVWYVANGEIRKVGNSSEGFSQAVVDIVVPPGTDLSRVEELAEDEARAFAADQEWQGKILEPPSVLGVQGVAADGVTIRVVAKTAVGDNAPVARALRARVIERLRREGVAWRGVEAADPEEPAPGPTVT
ncbi:MAG: moderate conductance mechanosensitive channel [Acidimicrobiaceae bacterium]|jgi:small conductance mechanosensitive channel|nr:moderate conductance mechanosensitive channel [Acidimicrobiaceae bacterium]